MRSKKDRERGKVSIQKKERGNEKSVQGVAHTNTTKEGSATLNTCSRKRQALDGVTALRTKTSSIAGWRGCFTCIANFSLYCR
jgi:hypothetical protein